MKDSGRNLALFLLRLAGLYLALGHGWGKIAGLIDGTSKFPSGLTEMGFPMPVVFAWIAALTEVVGGLLIATGLFTRVAALFAGFTMFVAAFVAHKFVQGVLAKSGITDTPLDTVKSWGNPEMPILYLLIFAALAFLGAGAWSLDAKLRKVK